MNRFYTAGDFHVDFGLLCPGDMDEKELSYFKMYGPQCWQGVEADPSGFKKMWYKIKEFDCKAISTSCDDRKEVAFTYQLWRKRENVADGLHTGVGSKLKCYMYS